MSGTATPVPTTGSSGNVWSDAIIYGSRWDSPGAVTTIGVNIAGQGRAERVDAADITALDPTGAEEAMIRNAMTSVEAVCNIDFQEVRSQDDADIVWAVVGDEDGEGALGWATLPVAGGGPASQGVIALNRDAFDPSSGPGALAVGGFDFCTPIHELGHALGLDHSHDEPTAFPGVDDSGDFGDFGLNQGVFTMMGYNDGWSTAPHGRTPSSVWGYQAGPMAIDIAALQSMYGANTATRAGADTYRLPDANEVGTSYLCIWDAGGYDRVLGTAGADTIDLRAASLRAEPGAGGFVSHAKDVHGGFTIANGVMIESARGGGGADAVQGNAGANALYGGNGNDRVLGDAGADRLWGGGGDDALTGGAGQDTLMGDSGADDFVFTAAHHSAGAAPDVAADFQKGQDDIVVAAIDANAGRGGNQAFALDAGGAFVAGEVRQSARAGDLVVEFNTDADVDAEMSILLQGVTTPLAAGDFVL